MPLYTMVREDSDGKYTPNLFWARLRIRQARESSSLCSKLLAGGGGKERLREVRHTGPCHGAYEVSDHGNLTPAEDCQALISGKGFNAGLGGLRLAGLSRKEGSAHHVLAGSRQFEFGDGPEELVRNLHEQARTVASTFVGAHGAAVFEIAEGGQGRFHDVVSRFPAERGNNSQAAGVLLLIRVVKTLGLRERGKALERRHGTLRFDIFGPTGVMKMGHGRRPSSRSCVWKGQRWPHLACPVTGTTKR